MAWFKKEKEKITTATEDKMDVPKGLWYKSPQEKLLMLMSWNAISESRRWFSC
jgi:hypothetical protein